MNQPKVLSQFEIEKNGAAIIGRPLTESLVLEQVFGPVENWLLQLGPYHLLYMPIHDRWLYWDWVHETWQDTGHKAFEVEFFLEGDQVKTRPSPAKPAPSHDLAQQTFAQRLTPPPDELAEPSAMPDLIESTAITPSPESDPGIGDPGPVSVEPEIEETAPAPAQQSEPDPFIPQASYKTVEPAAPVVEEPISSPRMVEEVEPVVEALPDEPEVAFPDLAMTEPELTAVEPEFAPAADEPTPEPVEPEMVEPEMAEPELPSFEEQAPEEDLEPVVMAAPEEPPARVPEVSLPEQPAAVEPEPPAPSAPLPAAAIPPQPAVPIPAAERQISTAPLKESDGKPAPAPQPAADLPVTPAPQRKTDEFAATMLYKRPVIWELRVIEGPQASIVYRLKPLTTIGRSSDNVISLDDPMASRHHARLEWAGDNYIAVDLNSSNGTFVDDTRISQPTLLDEGNQLLIGQTRFVVQKREG